MIEWRQQCSNLKRNHKTQPSSFTAVLNIFDVIFMINKVIAMENFDQFDFYMKFTFTFMPSECAKFVWKIERALHDRRLLRCLFWFARKEMDGNWLCCPESFYMALLILIFVPFASASGSISTWLSVFQLCELITGFVILKSFLRFIFYHDKFFFKISSSMPIFELPIKSIYYL